jgi:hypothetical protein
MCPAKGDIKPPTGVNTLTGQNSTLHHTQVQDSVQYFITVSTTSSIALGVLFCLVVFVVLIIYTILRNHHKLHTRRLHNLAALVGHGSPQQQDIPMENLDKAIEA